MGKVRRIAVIADVHADVEALRDALAQIDRLRCEMILCAGDIAGYGLFPEETIGLIRERGVVCVRGNHDRWVIGDGSPEDPSDVRPRDASGWDLSRGARKFLRNLPRLWRKTIDGVRLVVVHGSTKDEMDGIFPDIITGQQLRRRLDEAEADVLIVGHSHEPFHLTAPGGIVVNPGALFRRTIDEPQAIKVFDTKKGKFAETAMSSGGTFGILDLPSQTFEARSATDGAVVKIARASKE